MTSAPSRECVSESEDSSLRLPPCCQMSHAVGETTTISFESESWTDACLLAFPEVLLRQPVEERQSELLSRDQTSGNPVGFLLGSHVCGKPGDALMLFAA